MLLFHLATLSSLQAQQRTDSKAAPNKPYGEAAIVTNYVEHGVTQSEKNFALQAGFGYQMGPQARLGVWGSNVKFPTDSANLNLRPYADVKIDFTSNTSMVLGYQVNRFFPSDAYNGTIVSIDFAPFSYHVLIEVNSNWEGSGTSATWFAFRKEYLWTRGFVFTPTLGYTQASGTYAPFFNTRLAVGYKLADVLYEFVHSYNSSSSQFSGRGDMAFLFTVNARF